jgi:hypothetical protein
MARIRVAITSVRLIRKKPNKVCPQQFAVVEANRNDVKRDDLDSETGLYIEQTFEIKNMKS